MARFLFGLPSGSPTDGSSAFILSPVGAAEPTLTPKRPAPPCRACGRTSGILSPGVDDAHAAAAEHRLDLVARDARQGPPPRVQVPERGGQQVAADLDDVLDGLLDPLPDAVG